MTPSQLRDVISTTIRQHESAWVFKAGAEELIFQKVIGLESDKAILDALHAAFRDLEIYEGRK